MRGLRSLQLAFAEGVFVPERARLSRRIRANGLPPVRRVQVYHNNMFAALTSALQAVYPVIHRLVGTEFFGFAAAEYIRDYPSRSGNLHGFGDRFPEFLAKLPGAAAVPYLPDVARLEWAYHEVFHAAQGARLDLEGLQAVSATQWDQLGFSLNPASRLLESRYPAVRIWEVNQETYDGDQSVDLAEGGVCVLVLRGDLDIRMYTLGPGEHAWLAALAEGLNITHAYEQARMVEPQFNLDEPLKRHVMRGTLIDWHFTSHDNTARH